MGKEFCYKCEKATLWKIIECNGEIDKLECQECKATKTRECNFDDDMS